MEGGQNFRELFFLFFDRGGGGVWGGGGQGQRTKTFKVCLLILNQIQVFFGIYIFCSTITSKIHRSIR